jgi:cellulose synthase/poly-beta-1,6-N-acetylglucosamine synthase-like glycosyltransferase
MHVVAIISIVVVTAYALLILSYYSGWIKSPVFKQNKISQDIFVSIVVAVKDEASKISNLLELLTRQNYNPDKFEILIVNDHSTDETRNECSAYFSTFKNLIWFDLPDNLSGKKNAIRHGVSKARGELIITTDADCTMNNHWILTIANFYCYRKDKLIIGPVLLEEPIGFINRFFYLDQLSMASTTAGSTLLGNPIMCSGANFAFEKDVYEDMWHEMAENIPSGDDMFLLMAIKKRWPKKIGFVKSVDALVTTHSEKGLNAYLQQRKRWVAKGKYYNDNQIIGIALLVSGLNMLILILGVYSTCHLQMLYIFITILVIKFIIDTLLLKSVSNFYNKKRLGFSYVLAQIAYPIYIVFIGFYGIFGSYKWKNRQYKA